MEKFIRRKWVKGSTLFQDYLVWTEDTPNMSTIISANAQSPAQRIYSDSFVDVGEVVALSMLDETLQPDTKGTGKHIKEQESFSTIDSRIHFILFINIPIDLLINPHAKV